MAMTTTMTLPSRTIMKTISMTMTVLTGDDDNYYDDDDDGDGGGVG